jgi:hypothetical protein
MARSVEAPLRKMPVRAKLSGLAAALALGALAVGCGPVGPADSQGDAVVPQEAVNGLPTPEGFSFAEPVEQVGAIGLASALEGDFQAIESSGFVDAAVRMWQGEGRELTAAVGVFSSHGAALTVASAASEPVLNRDDARAWTPSGLNGSRGARAIEDPPERVLAIAKGPNALIVTAEGDVPDEVLEDAVERLSEFAGS